MVDNVVKV